MKKVQATTRPDYFWPEIWIEMSTKFKRKNSRNGLLRSQSSTVLELRGIHVIDPEDEDFEETILERRKENGNSLRSCHALQDGDKETLHGARWNWRVETQNQVCFVLLKLTNSQGLFRETMTITSRRKGSSLLLIICLCSDQFQCTKRWKFQLRQLQWKNHGTSSGRSLRGRWMRWRTREMFFWRHQKRKRKSTLLHWWPLSSQEYRFRTISTRGDIVKDDSGSYAVFTSQNTDRQPRNWLLHKQRNFLRDYQDVLDKPPTQYQLTPRWKWKTVHGCLKNSINGHSVGQASKTQWFFLHEISPDTHLQALVERTSWQSSIGTWMGKGTALRMSNCWPKTRIIHIGIRWWH